jgi:hypothetical protein
VTNLNRKQRNKMAVVKEGQQVTEVIIQEGVPTYERINDAVAEPVVYMIDRYVVGGFYRVNAERGIDENLNAPGMTASCRWPSPTPACCPTGREAGRQRAQPLLHVRRDRPPGHALFWTMTLVVSFKYVLLILRADNNGEGGLIAMMALATQAVKERPELRRRLLLLGMFGTAIFFGDASSPRPSRCSARSRASTSTPRSTTG